MSNWMWRSAPATRLAALRVLVGAYTVVFLLARSASFWQTADLPAWQTEGVGVLWFLDTPWSPDVVHLLFLATIALGAAFTVGIGFRFTGPAFALVFLVMSTYRLSFGHVIHTEHLVALHLLALGFSQSADAWSFDSRRRRAEPIDHVRYGIPIRAMILVTVITYVLAGVAKVRHGGMDWLVGDVLRNQVAYDNLRKELLGSPHSPIGGWTVRFAWIFPPAAVLTTVVEIGALATLTSSKRARWVWAVAAWGFHLVVLALMAISFPYPLSFVAYACLFDVERGAERLIQAARRRTGRTSDSKSDKLSAATSGGIPPIKG
ncbi:MAG: HTTM domain-containing protein [Actinomycetota bacterium]|nr:HTTM domain-containing protein [Actinomycetota bacterium]MDA2970658.1 HTTM domain-containing protein [Actinomycetota bacterium]MDA3000314.1 HTTM domain-containing protein [Actinomycetota bacterium]